MLTETEKAVNKHLWLMGLAPVVVQGSRTSMRKTAPMTVRKISNRPLQSKAQRGEMTGRAWGYARGILCDTPAMGIGVAPFSQKDAETIAQWAWAAGYQAALRDVRKGKRNP